MSTIDNPLVGPIPTEIPLTDPPLVRVLAQVRFGEILSVEESMASFQETIREEYPVLRSETIEVQIASAGNIVDKQSRRIWRFLDASGAWRASMSGDFLALETTRYTSRSDFLSRFEVLLGALEEHLAPKLIVRIGIRYIDRVTGPNLGDLTSLVQPAVAGILGSELGGGVLQTLTRSVFELPDALGQMSACWGCLPAGATADPAAIEPLDEQSWFLDLDAFSNDSRPLDVQAILVQTRQLVEKVYAMFRWVVNEDFLRRYGGTP